MYIEDKKEKKYTKDEDSVHECYGTIYVFKHHTSSIGEDSIELTPQTHGDKKPKPLGETEGAFLLFSNYAN